MDKILTEQELRAQTKTAMEVLQRNEVKIREYEGVLTLGVGLRERNGKFYWGEICICIHVDKKKSLAELNKSQILPQQIEQIPVDVIEIQIDNETNEIGVSDANEGKYRPMLSGCQVTTGIGGKGTAGLFGYSDYSSSDPLGFMTCDHVLKDSDIVYQPYEYGDIPSVGNVIYRNTEYIGDSKLAQLDIAIVQLNSEIKATNGWLGDSNISLGVNVDQIYAGKPVQKYGRTTLRTKGFISRLGTKIPGTEFLTYIAVLGPRNPKPKGGHKTFATSGDSGAALLDMNGNVLGIICQVASNVVGIKSAHSSDIRYIKSKVGDKLDYPIPDKLQNTLIAEDVERLNEYKKILLGTAEGKKFLTAFIKYYPEGRSLILNNKKCLVTWVRNFGAKFVKLRKESSTTIDYNLVKEVNGRSIEELLKAMFEVLYKHGSKDFGEALTTYADRVIDSFNSQTTLDEVIHSLAAD